jgi:inhibitor of cysteine peptidase
MSVSPMPTPSTCPPSDEESVMSRTHRRSTAALLSAALLTGCGLAGPDTYGLDERQISTEIGDEFTLSVPLDVAMGEHWYVTAPEPDESVVRSVGEEEEWGGSGADEGGGNGTHSFRFETVGEGTTKIRLIQCPYTGCTGVGDMGGPVVPSPVPEGSPTPAPENRPKIHTYTVTVRQP